MYYLKITYDISCNKYTFVPIDGEEHGVTQGLGVLAKEKDNGTFLVKTFTFERDNSGDINLEKKKITKSHTIKIGKKYSGCYSTPEWSYLEGLYYRHPSYEIEIVDGNAVLKENADPVVKAQIYVYMGEYIKADELLNSILQPDPNYYYFTNREANKLQAQRYELGLGVEKNLDKAYIHYLYAEAVADVIRFMNMGYGKGVLEENHNCIVFCEYHFYKLLYEAGEKEYAEYRVFWNADCWLYEWHEKSSTDKKDIQERKNYALCRRQACEWIMEKGYEEKVLNNKFTLYLGAYLAYLEEGSEGKCTYIYENDDSKYRETSLLSAENYIKRAVESGNEFAIRGKAFIDMIKGEVK